MKYEEFIFKNYVYNEGSNTLSMFYEYKGGPVFEETITFSDGARTLSDNEKSALDKAFRLIFLLSGVSYYKAYVPNLLKCEAFQLDSKTTYFLKKVYLNGLGEFAFRNGISLKDKLNFIAEDAENAGPVSLKLRERSLVPVGGGKDSAVTIEMLKSAGKETSLFAVGSQDGVVAPILNTIKQSGLSSIVIKRVISKNLFELNKMGVFNGHVPVTAILSSITVAAAILYDFKSIVFSNEHSASSPNFKMDGLEINHQYSKSLCFEKDFSDFVHDYVSSNIEYFSLLRPLTEAEIMRRFASLENYHSIFRSCNAAFRQDKASRAGNWCGKCPKCRFVFLALASFIDKDKLINIFGNNLMNDISQIDGYKELCGLLNYKPFECVGEIEESRLLLKRLCELEEWKNDVVVRSLRDEIVFDKKEFDNKCAALFSARYDNRLPPSFRNIIDGR